MSTIKQVEANRLNSQKSTGPVSPAGKAVSCMNALKAGVHAKSQIIPGEDPAELDQLTANYYRDFQPQHQVEADLVDSMISNAWELRRLRKAEAEIWDDGIEKNIDSQREWGKGREPHHLQGRAYATQEKSLDRCHNRIAAVERAFRASLEAFVKLRKQGIGLPETAPAPPASRNDETKPISEAQQTFNPVSAEPQLKNGPPVTVPGNEPLKI